MGPADGDGDGAVLALVIRAGGPGLLFEVGPEPADLLGDAGVAFDGEVLAAAIAAQVRVALAGRDDGVRIALDACGSASRRLLLRGNAEVGAARVFAEVNLDTVGFEGDSRLLRLVREGVDEITESGVGNVSEAGISV